MRGDRSRRSPEELRCSPEQRRDRAPRSPARSSSASSTWRNPIVPTPLHIPTMTNDRSQEETTERSVGILTEGQREYLRGDKEFEHAQSERDMRYKIRERIKNALLDFEILVEHLEPATGSSCTRTYVRRRSEETNASTPTSYRAGTNSPGWCTRRRSCVSRRRKSTCRSRDSSNSE